MTLDRNFRGTGGLRRLAVLGSLLATLGGGAAIAVAPSASAHPPLDCTVDVNDPGCHGDGAGGKGAAGVGRSFLVDSDIEYLDFHGMIVDFNAADWDTYDDYWYAVLDYWKLHAPSNRACDVITDWSCRWEFDSQGDVVVFRIHKN